ncbi:MAG: XRE family transcriptional regulator [Prevotellaceae bacterium]|nr:XRE family transcriptional regulator [Prevotellaceae bacterium]
MREEKQLYQKQMPYSLFIYKSRYYRTEKGKRRAKREQISIIAEVLKADPEELFVLWLADQVTAVVADETSIAKRVLKIADNSLNNNE